MENMSLVNELTIELADVVSCPVQELRDKIAAVIGGYSVTKLKNTLPSTGDGSTTIYLINEFKKSQIAIGNSEKTLKAYLSAINKLYIFFNREVNLLTSEDIIFYLDYYRFHGDTGLNKVSDSSVRNRYLYLSAFYSFLYNKKYIAENPFFAIDTPRAAKPDKVPLSNGEIEKMEIAMKARSKKMEIRDKAMFSFMVDTGVRVNELSHIKLSDVDFVKRTCEVKKPKGKNIRHVVFGEATAVRLEEYLKTRNDVFMDGDMYYDIDTPLFASLDYSHHKLSNGAVREELKKLGNISGVTRVHPHLLRATCCTRLIKKGVPLNVVADELGHSNLSTLDRYAKVDLESRRQMIQAVI